MKREWLRGCGRNRLREKGRLNHLPLSLSISLSLSLSLFFPPSVFLSVSLSLPLSLSLCLCLSLSRQGYGSKTITAPRRRTLDRAPLVSCSAAPHAVGAFFGLWRRARITAASPLDALAETSSKISACAIPLELQVSNLTCRLL